MIPCLKVHRASDRYRPTAVRCRLPAMCLVVVPRPSCLQPARTEPRLDVPQRVMHTHPVHMRALSEDNRRRERQEKDAEPPQVHGWILDLKTNMSSRRIRLSQNRNRRVHSDRDSGQKENSHRSVHTTIVVRCNFPSPDARQRPCLSPSALSQVVPLPPRSLTRLTTGLAGRSAPAAICRSRAGPTP